MTEKSSSYGQILRSSVVIGGASAFTLVFSLIRNKALAVLLGPAGFGLVGLYTAIVDVAHSLAGMGVNQSGVRQIAESAAAGGMERASATAYVLRRTSVVLGALGAVGLLIFAEPVAIASFGDSQRAGAVRLLSGVVLLALIADGQSALLQGLRRIGDLAKARVLGAFYGTVAVVAITYAIGERGIVPALLVAGALSVATAAWYVRKLAIAAPKMSMPAISKEAAELLKLGAAFMVSGFVVMGAAYAVRAIVSTEDGLHSAGLYQAAWTLGGLYTGFILQAMGIDFYPRLVGAIGDTELRARLVDEQTSASLMLAGPGILATLALAPLALHILYSSEFRDAAATLRWICAGMALRVITWPPGFLIVSMNERWVFMGVEIAWGIVNVGLTALLVRQYGLEGAGIAFAASYVFHGVVIYAVTYTRYGFRPQPSTLLTGALFLCSTVAVLASFYLLSDRDATILAATLTLIIGVLSLWALLRIVPHERLPRPIMRCLRLVQRTKGEH